MRPRVGDEFVWMPAGTGYDEQLEQVADVVREDGDAWIVEYAVPGVRNHVLSSLVPGLSVGRTSTCRVRWDGGQWVRDDSDIEVR